MSAEFPPDPQLIERAILLARELQERAVELQTAGERRQQAELDWMLQTPADKVTLVQLTDQAFRARDAARESGGRSRDRQTKPCRHSERSHWRLGDNGGVKNR